MQEFQAAFISYGRADSKAFATQLYKRLVEKGLKIWFDQNDIPLGVDFQNQIDDGIEKSDNFLFIIAPHSVNSPYCRKEIELALRRNKRIIPLLHVEQISFETWQQRNPNREPSEWESYKTAGLHSSFPNMHPAIGKINWVYFREGIDDFEQSLAGLLEIFDRHKDYVHQHTVLLARALEWEQRQKQSSYLLVGDDRKAAEAWLKFRFDEQPPCIPTDLHCEFICESTKNANNLMTHIFLSYSEQDRAVMQKISRNLMREGYTLWTNKTDIKTGTDFAEMINRGIEEADNLVFLMSPDSLQSTYCQQELEHARKYNKRIIPLLVVPVPLEEIPPEIRAIQFIDMTDHEDQGEYLADISKLVRVLREEAVYYEQHKILLAKALKWERQKRNPSILLRGHNLLQAEAWLKASRGRSHHSPTPLHETFLAESLKQPPEGALDVFVSYSRTDSDFARKLNEGLQIQGKTTWFDQESIAAGTDFQKEIFRGIERCNNFLFIISPESVNSPYCAGEVEYAAKLGKRVVGALYREVQEGDLHPVLARVQWVDFQRHGGDFFINFGDLIRTLDTDPEHLRNHTRVLLKAIDWEQHDRDDSYLLRGKDLVASETWLRETAGKEPHPTDLQQDYLKASRLLPLKKIKFWKVALTSVVVAAVVGGIRQPGWLKPAELAAYDHLVRLRPDEPQDDRLVIIAVDAPSSEMFDRSPRYRFGRGSIPDPALSDLLQILNRNQAKLIGLDLFRDFTPIPELAKTLRQSSNLVAICKGSGTNDRGETLPGTKAPTDVPLERVGFANFVDDGGMYLRRQYLIAGNDPDYCDTEESFSLVLARRYLEAQGKPYTPTDFDAEPVPPIKFGNTVIPPLFGNGSGYRDLKDHLDNYDLGGYQIMLNYRTYQGSPDEFAPVVSLKDVLENEIPAEQFRDRIVLIGIYDKADRNADYWDTPFGEVPGVVLQAQMVSQLINATLANRPLIWWMPLWAEMVWILGWSLVGGVVVWWFRRSHLLAIAGGVTIVTLYGVCWGVMIVSSGWLPLAPALLALLATGGGVAYLNYLRLKG